MAGGPVTFFDPDLMKFGNAMSPFQTMPSFEAANLAMQRPFEDRYNPRYDWNDWWGGYVGEDEYVGGAPVTLAMGGPVTLAMGPGPGESVVDKRALVASAVIAGLTTLLAFREKDHAFEIVAAGACGVALDR